MTTASAGRLKRGDELELSVDALAHGGSGVARLNGYVVFVSGAFPGDRVRAVIERSRRDYAQARAVEVLSPGPDRVAPQADHPGAPWQALAYERQLEVKQQQVHDALRRIGRLERFTLEPIVPALERWRYRNKLEYSFGAGPDGQLVCGFHAPGRWDQIVEVGDCLLASRRSNQARERIVAWCREQALRPLDRRAGGGLLRNLVIREGRRTGMLQARLVTAEGSVDRVSLAGAARDLDGMLWTRQAAAAEVTHGGETELICGVERIEEEIAGMRFSISPDAFFQTNTEMAERLCELVVQYAAPTGFERVYDLCCGIGTLGLVLAPRVAEVWGMEIVEAAVADAVANARANQVDNAGFVVGDVRLGLRELVAQAGRPDLVVLDPPRAGLSQKVIRRVIEAAPRRIVYVSCNPTTLAPNAAQLVGAGWELVRVRPVDMFPNTPHIECVAELVRAA
ncbi:MAG TPA: 23S rRNA (uracil(1939)-C(5))-methyltransferase RlmD [Solirubrobacteraceae bacterium]|nr:23S rRNA (uracil(1939)-C(5))-methyltransferase RlmD [Solirubrobacteraceae bacterium]